MQLTGCNYIGGRTSALGAQTFRAVDPALNTELEPTFHEATAAEIDQVMQLSEEAFVQYCRRNGRERAAFLRAIAVNIEELGDELIARAVAETALPSARLLGERGRTCGQLRLFADLIEEGSWVDARIDHANPTRKPVAKPDLRRMRIAIGPVAVFAASNFPLAFSVAGGDTASALAAGCTVVIKAHPSHPGTSELSFSAMLQAAAATGMPDGVVSLLHGIDPQVSLALVHHPLTQAVGFTGSLRAGRALFDAAASRPRPIPLYAEMGSINPVFLLPGALRERGQQIAEGLANSVLLGVGQFCTNPGVIIGPVDSAMRDLVNRLAELISGAPVGTMLNRNIAEAFAAGCRRLSQTPGTHVVAQSPTTPQIPAHAAAAIFSTSAENFLENRLLHAELFGPATLVVTARSPAQFEQIASQLDGQLTATIHAAAGELVEHTRLVETLQRKTGRLVFNGYPTGVEVCPAMHHGGPYPATTDSRSTSVGTAAIERFARPVSYQDCPSELLPPELREDNPLRLWRLVDGQRERGSR